MGIWQPLKKNCGFINIYAPQELNRKQALRSEVTTLINSDLNTYWFIFGDFNEVRNAEERLGSTFYPRNAALFNKFIHEAGLIEVNMGGRRFTYSTLSGDKHSKLDRFLVSSNSLSLWPQLNVIVLPRLHSDHCPLILSSNSPDFGPSPFRAYNSWLCEPDFNDIMKAGWVYSCTIGRGLHSYPMLIVAKILKNLKEKIKEWRIKKTLAKSLELKDLVKKIDEIDLKAESLPLDSVTLDIRRNCYKRVLEIEQANLADLKQKSRVKWALEGDENSAFFHGMINKNIRVQRVNGFKINGIWVSDPIKIKAAAVKCFSERFAEQIPNRPRLISGKFRKLSPQVMESLESPFG